MFLGDSAASADRKERPPGSPLGASKHSWSHSLSQTVPHLAEWFPLESELSRASWGRFRSIPVRHSGTLAFRLPTSDFRLPTSDNSTKEHQGLCLSPKLLTPLPPTSLGLRAASGRLTTCYFQLFSAFLRKSAQTLVLRARIEMKVQWIGSWRGRLLLGKGPRGLGDFKK